MMPKRIQLTRRREFNLSRHSRALNGLVAVKVDRSSRWGNPYVIGEPIDLVVAERWGFHLKYTDDQAVDRADAVGCFHRLLAFDAAAVAMIRRELVGKNLACWCPLSEPCHADVLLAIANRDEGSTSTGDVS